MKKELKKTKEEIKDMLSWAKHVFWKYKLLVSKLKEELKKRK